MKKKLLLILFSLILLSFALGMVSEKKLSMLSKVSAISGVYTLWDDTRSHRWDSAFQEITIKSSMDAQEQKAYFYSSDKKAPLVISLHTWSGDYKQQDDLSDIILGKRWNYIHPDFRGKNSTFEACLSNNVISDIDDAISFAIANGNVDLKNIFVIGVSGGGYAALGAYLKSTHNINTFMAWVPISDLTSWYAQSKSRKSHYANDILDCTASDENLNIQEAKLRSPLYWEKPSKLQRIEIYAGIHDGYNGSVPISHSINFYNKIASSFNAQVTTQESMMLLSRGVNPEKVYEQIQNRDLFFTKETENAALYIFDGSHEMLTDYTVKRIESLVVKD